MIGYKIAIYIAISIISFSAGFKYEIADGGITFGVMMLILELGCAFFKYLETDKTPFQDVDRRYR